MCAEIECVCECVECECVCGMRVDCMWTGFVLPLLKASAAVMDSDYASLTTSSLRFFFWFLLLYVLCSSSASALRISCVLYIQF